MKRNEKIQQEITRLIDEAADKARKPWRQYDVTKGNLATLEELGLLEYMPAGFGNRDAKAVISAAQDDGTNTRTHRMDDTAEYGDGSTLYQLLNTLEVNDSDDNDGKIAVGDTLEILDHVVFQHLSKGTVIEPSIPHQIRGYGRIVTVTAVFVDEFEDEHFNPIYEYSYETSHGIFDASQVKKVS